MLRRVGWREDWREAGRLSREQRKAAPVSYVKIFLAVLAAIWVGYALISAARL